MGEPTTWDQFRESIGTICIGIVVAIIIVLFLMRMQDWTLTALESLLVLIFGLGALKAFKFSDEQNAFFYPVGLFFGIILCAVTLISPYGDDLIRWTTVQTNTSVTVTQTLVPTTTSAVTALPTTVLTASPTMGVTMPFTTATGTFAPTTIATSVPTVVHTTVPTVIHTTVPTLVRTTVPLMTPTPPSAIAASQSFTPGGITILVIVIALALLIAYLLEMRKVKK